MVIVSDAVPKTQLSPEDGATPPTHAAALLNELVAEPPQVAVAAFVLADPRSPAVTKSAKVVLARVGRVVFMGGVWLGGRVWGIGFG